MEQCPVEMGSWHIDSGQPVEPTPGFDTEFAYSFRLDGPGGEQAELRMEWVETPGDPVDSSAHTTADRYLENLSPGGWPARLVVIDREANYRVLEPEDAD